MASLANNTNLDVQTRGLAVEVLATLADRRPGMIRKFPEFTETLVPIAFKMMIDMNEVCVSVKQT